MKLVNLFPRVAFHVCGSRNLLQEETFGSFPNLLLAEIFTMLKLYQKYGHNKKHMECRWIQKCMLALIFVNGLN